ncbi:MAG: ATP-binding cassette domain-containing protein [Clostridia bacterium]|nr:ATP-binding cassette domain-containing protein [Clostridia bacterium]
MLRIDNLCKSFDGKEVIKDLSLSFPKSGLVAICGPSGCGKSTLLHIIAGIEKPSSGQITFDDRSNSISMSFQEPRLLPDITALQNVNFVLGDKKATLSRAKELLLAVDIQNVGLYPEELSGGMKARVSIARALAKEADIYIFDEPFANLDKETALRCVDVIKKETAGALTIAVLHDTELAERISDKVIYFK